MVFMTVKGDYNASLEAIKADVCTTTTDIKNIRDINISTDIKTYDRNFEFQERIPTRKERRKLKNQRKK